MIALGDGVDECIGDVEGLADAGDALVVIPENTHRSGFIGVANKDWFESLAVGEVVLPRGAIFSAGSDVGILPGDADANEAYAGGDSGNKAAGWKVGVALGVHLGPWVLAPKENFSASMLLWIAVVARGCDDVAAWKEAFNDLGVAGDIGINGVNLLADELCPLAGGARPLKVPGEDLHGASGDSLRHSRDLCRLYLVHQNLWVKPELLQQRIQTRGRELLCR